MVLSHITVERISVYLKNQSSLHYPQAVKPVNAVGLSGVFLKDWTQSCLSQITQEEEMIAPYKHKQTDVLTSITSKTMLKIWV